MISSGLYKRLSVAHKTKKMPDDPKFGEVLGIKGSRITLTDNEIKDTAKVNMSIESRGILLKRTTKKFIAKKSYFPIFLKTINVCWFTINEKGTHTIS